VKAEDAIGWAKSRWWTFVVVASLLIAFEIATWHFFAGARSVVYETLLIIGYVTVLACLILARRVKFAAPAALGVVCGLPVAAIYLVADALR